MTTRYKPQFKASGSAKWQSFPSAYSFGSKGIATKFVKATSKAYKSVKRIGKFRVKKERM
jgi:hypothetical protein